MSTCEFCKVGTGGAGVVVGTRGACCCGELGWAAAGTGMDKGASRATMNAPVQIVFIIDEVPLHAPVPTGASRAWMHAPDAFAAIRGRILGRRHFRKPIWLLWLTRWRPLFVAAQCGGRPCAARYNWATGARP